MLTVFLWCIAFFCLQIQYYRIDWSVSQQDCLFPGGLLFAGKFRVCCGVSKGDFCRYWILPSM